MAERIKMTPQELNEGAAYLRNRLSNITTEVKALDDKIRHVSAGWEGSAQQAYLQRYEELLPILKETLPEVVEALAMKLDAAANAIRETDQQIAQAFKG